MYEGMLQIYIVEGEKFITLLVYVVYGMLCEETIHPAYIMNCSVLFWSPGQRGCLQKMELALTLLMA
jgi:hypothetical protein